MPDDVIGRITKAFRSYLPDFASRVRELNRKIERGEISGADANDAARQILHTLDNRIHFAAASSEKWPEQNDHVKEVLRQISAAKRFITDTSPQDELGKLISILDEVVNNLTRYLPSQPEFKKDSPPKGESLPEGIPSQLPSLSIIVDSDVDQEAFAELLGELSAIYSELSDGDELIIVEGKLPVGEEVFA